VDERARWQQHFAAVIITGNGDEIAAATAGALEALDRGADDAAAKQAGRDALRRHRAARAVHHDADDPPPPSPAPEDPPRPPHSSRRFPLLRRRREARSTPGFT